MVCGAYSIQHEECSREQLHTHHVNAAGCHRDYRTFASFRIFVHFYDFQHPTVCMLDVGPIGSDLSPAFTISSSSVTRTFSRISVV